MLYNVCNNFFCVSGGPNAEVFRNRKGFFSLNTQVICSSKNYILDIVARWPGSSHDSHIFRNSFIKRRFEAGEFGDSVLLGDSAYPLSNYLMTPIHNPNTPAEQMYNRSHISTRTIIERTIGIWKRRFAILTMGLRCNTMLAQKIIVATALLHNIAVTNRDEVIINDGYPFEDEDNNFLAENNANNHIFQTYINYFQRFV